MKSHPSTYGAIYIFEDNYILMMPCMTQYLSKGVSLAIKLLTLTKVNVYFFMGIEKENKCIKKNKKIPSQLYAWNPFYSPTLSLGRMK